MKNQAFTVTLAKMANMATASLLGRKTALTGSPEVLSVDDVLAMLNLADAVTGVSGTAPVVSSGGATPAISMAAATALVNGYMTSVYAAKLDGIAVGANAYVHPNHSGDVTSTGDGATAIGTGKVTLAMQSDMATASLIGRKTAGAGAPEVLSKADALTLLNVADGANNYVHPNHSGDVTSVADGAQTIGANKVTYGQMQQVSATDKILGRATAGAGNVEEISCTAAGRAILDDVNAAAQLATLGALPLAGGTLTGTLQSSSNPFFKYNLDADGTVFSAYHTDGTTRKWQLDTLSHSFSLYMQDAAAYVFNITAAGNCFIGRTIGAGNANAILDVYSTTKAFMPPRMTTTQKNNIASPTEGMIVWDLTGHVLSYYNGTSWI